MLERAIDRSIESIERSIDRADHGSDTHSLSLERARTLDARRRVMNRPLCATRRLFPSHFLVTAAHLCRPTGRCEVRAEISPAAAGDAAECEAARRALDIDADAATAAATALPFDTLVRGSVSAGAYADFRVDVGAGDEHENFVVEVEDPSIRERL